MRAFQRTAGDEYQPSTHHERRPKLKNLQRSEVAGAAEAKAPTQELVLERLKDDHE